MCFALDCMMPAQWNFETRRLLTYEMDSNWFVSSKYEHVTKGSQIEVNLDTKGSEIFNQLKIQQHFENFR